MRGAINFSETVLYSPMSLIGRYPLHVSGRWVLRVANAADGDAQGVLSSAQDHHTSGRGAHHT